MKVFLTKLLSSKLKLVADSAYLLTYIYIYAYGGNNIYVTFKLEYHRFREKNVNFSV